MIKDLKKGKLKDLLIILSKYNKIIVIGQQRSGTRICARIISYHTQKKYFDEAEFLNRDYNKMFYLINTFDGVFHAPNGFFQLKELINNLKLAIIFVDRDKIEIENSIKRINWNFIDDHKALLKTFFSHEVSQIKSDNLIEQKKEIWFRFFEKAPTCYTILYEWLEASPLFISKEKRKNFSAGQTEIQ